MKHKFIQDDIEKNKCCGCCQCSKTQKRLTWFFCFLPLASLAVLLVVILIRAATLESKLVVEPLDPQPKFMNLSSSEKNSMTKRFSEAIQIRTVSYNATSQENDALKNFQDFLRANYPHMFDNTAYITHEVINEYSLLFRIEGSVTTSHPYLLCAHLDVVPEGDLTQWSRPPFSGDIFTDTDDIDYIFGRGSIDDKQAVIGILEALQFMIVEGHRPQRTFYVAFGHDEEVGGYNGAGQIAQVLEQRLEERGEKLSFILDEGMFVMDGVFPGVSDPIGNFQLSSN